MVDPDQYYICCYEGREPEGPGLEHATAHDLALARESPDHRFRVGLGRRFDAGCRSLAQRADLRIVLEATTGIHRSPFGDSDQLMRLIVGDVWNEPSTSRFSGRWACGTLLVRLHTTGGGEAVFDGAGLFEIMGSDGQTTVFEAVIPQGLMERIVRELASLYATALLDGWTAISGARQAGPLSPIGMAAILDGWPPRTLELLDPILGAEVELA